MEKPSISLTSSSRIPLAFFLALQICTQEQRAAAKPKNATISAVFAFGDSLVDTGNNNKLCTLVKANFPPYGRDFMGGKATGRFSNGKVPADLIADRLGIKEFLPAFLDPGLQPRDLLGGVNFASGGAGFDPLTPELVAVISMSKQLQLFGKYKRKLKKLVGRKRADSIIHNGLYVVAAGSDDIVNTYYHTPTRMFEYDMPSYLEFLAAMASSFLQELHGMGARRIVMFGAAPLGCLPSQRTLAGGLRRECVVEYNQVAQSFNSKMLWEGRRLSGAFPGAGLVFLDGYSLALDIIMNPRKYGFEISDRGCCGTGLVETAFLCNRLWDVFSCSNISGYVFWDSYHPTESVYKILVDNLMGEYLDSFNNGHRRLRFSCSSTRSCIN